MAQTQDISVRVYRQSWITKRKQATSQDTNILLPDKLNTFFACIEDNTVPPTRPAPKDCELSFSTADMSKTFKSVNPRKAADQLAEVFKDIFNLSPSQSCTQENKGN